MVERGKGYIRSISLGRDGVFWLLLTVDDVAKIGNNVGFIRKLRDSQCILFGQRCSNHHGCYMAIEQFSGSRRRGFILIPEGKKIWEWCGLVEVMRYVLAPYFPCLKHLRQPSQRGHLESYPSFLNVGHLERMELASL